METNKLIIIFSILLCCGIANAQTDTTRKYYFVTKKDTTFCKKLQYSTTAQGYLNKLEYNDMNGKEIVLKGQKNVPDVLTFNIDTIILDKVPLKADKPESYIRYTQRVVDGKLKVYLAQQGYYEGVKYSDSDSPYADQNGYVDTGGPAGIYRFYLKMPDGTYYKINSKKNMKNYIKPFLQKCSEFVNEYTGDYSTKEEPFMEMIKLYNSLCK
jgi:hypothetical protein